MKIVHVVDSMEIGGAETLVLQMCRLQREQGHEVSVYAVAALGALGTQMRNENFTVISNIGRHLSDSARNLYGLFKTSRPEVVHIHNPTPTIYAAAAARLAGAASIVSTRHSLVAPPHNRVAEFKYSIAARFCDWVVGICQATTDNLIAMRTVPPKKIVSIYNAAAPLREPSTAERPPKSGFTLTFVGRLQPVKNLPLMLTAFRVALDHSSDLRLWIVGDGIERPALEKLSHELNISEQVTFWGQQMDVAPFLSASDAFIMSSKSEGLPMSLLQALSLGLPAIVTDVGGMPEVVRKTDSGYVVPPSRPDEMAKAILEMAGAHVERQKFSINAKAGFYSQFVLQIMTDAYMKLYCDTPRARKMALK
jgi:glycosyltransferase involved in cell wall biosynthesis